LAICPWGQRVPGLKTFLFTCYLVCSAEGKEVDIPRVVNDVKEMDAITL
jgi:hypothetical protein